MKTCCPACGAVASLDVLIGNEGARAAILIALKYPAPIGNLMVQYLALFRPAARQLSFDRVATLLNELLPMIAAAAIQRNGRTWSAPQDYWRLALEDIVTKRDKLTLPLKSHGYLLEIIVGYSNKAEAKAETHSEARKGGHTPVGHAPAAAPPSRPNPPKPRGNMPASVKEILKTRKGNDEI
jgi:hypothetical protein